MKKIIILLAIVFSLFARGQEYFGTKKVYCPIANEGDKALFSAGLDGLKHPKKYEASLTNYLKIIKNQPNTCDAYFMAGYFYQLKNQPDLALQYFQIADSLAQNKSIEFKQYVACNYFLAKKITLAKNKFMEIITYFPENPEGYLGIASTELDSPTKGLQDVALAFEKYASAKQEIPAEANLTKAILLTLNHQYKESMAFFDQAETSLKHDERFLIYSSLTWLEVGKMYHDKELKKEAKKRFDKIQNKNNIPAELSKKFVF